MRSIPIWILLLAFSGPAYAVDGVVEINNARAEAGGVTSGDEPGYPVVITQSGSYRLTGDLFVSGANLGVIVITVEDVTLDLNGFTIRCLYFINPCAGNGSGVGIEAGSQSNVAIRNGTVRDMGATGLRLRGDDSRVDDVRAISNGQKGIVVGPHGVVRGSLATSNGDSGIDAGIGSVVSGNAAAYNSGGSFSGGIVAASGSTVVGNTAHQNTNWGISASNGSTVSGNSAIQNGGDGFSLGNGVMVSGNAAYLNGGDGISTAQSCLVQRNNVFNNTGFGLKLLGDSAYGENLINDNGGGTVSVAGVINMGSNSCNGTATCP
jgi:hypothetical protein